MTLCVDLPDRGWTESGLCRRLSIDIDPAAGEETS
jgi:hypothetical protein